MCFSLLFLFAIRHLDLIVSRVYDNTNKMPTNKAHLFFKELECIELIERYIR